MIIIFTDAFNLVADYIKAFISRLVGIKRSVKITCFLVFSMFLIVLSLYFSGVRFAYRVNYGGKVIATVKNKQQFETAVDIVKQRVNATGSAVESAVSNPQYVAVIVSNGGIDSEEIIADAIIDNTEDIVNATSLTIDGELVAVVADDEIDTYLEEYLEGYKIEGADCECEFVESFETEEGYYLSDEISGIDDVKQAISKLTVKTTATTVLLEEINYGVIKQNTNEQPIGTNKVQVKGEKGTKKLVESVTLINGEEVERLTVSDEVVSEPVDEVVLVGTAKSVASAQQKAVAHNSGFIVPLPNGSWSISAYYGDGRNHKGIDMRAPKGTQIFAVSSGVVRYSAYNGGYGYCVEIDHQNGIVTRYAHASALCVKVGERVSAGDVIALVGATGNATGNHLHFEVLINGTQVDPLPYIRLD